jgi:hypothetical protein
MYVNELLRQSEISRRHLNDITLDKTTFISARITEEKQDREKLSGEKLNATTLDGEVVFALVYFLIITETLIFLKLSIKSYHSAQNRINTLNTLNQVPCKNCHFFTDKNYLHCAVNPTTVLKKEAINCPDYYPQSSKFPHWF